MNKILKLLATLLFANNALATNLILLSPKLPPITRPLLFKSNQNSVKYPSPLRQSDQIISSSDSEIPDLSLDLETLGSEPNLMNLDIEDASDKECLKKCIEKCIEVLTPRNDLIIDSFHNQGDLIEAIKSNDSIKIQQYLEKNDAIFDKRIPSTGMTILMFAIKNASANTVLFLIRNHKFHIDAKGSAFCYTALMLAASREEMLEVVAALLIRGANLKKTDKLGHTTLYYARNAQNLKAVQFLSHYIE